jgi:transposase
MKKTFRPWQVDQSLLLPPTVHDFVPADHPAHFVRELVREALDLSAITDSYEEARGYPPYDPSMMTALLLYGYSRGVYSSRRLARACAERLDFMAVTALNRPDFRTIADFRRRHLEALSGLFVQVLHLCRKAGLATLGHVALDGTKIKANASKHKAMSYGRMKKAEADLEAEVAGWLKAAAAADTEEDAALGERRGDEMPGWVADKTRRLAKIRAARAALEAEAKAKAEENAAAEQVSQRRRGGRKPTTPPGTPKDKAQRNFTDPESRIMKGRDGFIQGYNAQAAVDGDNQIIVAHGLTDCAADSGQLIPMIDALIANTGQTPLQASADSGFCSEANIQAMEDRKIDAFIATGRQKHGQAAADGGTSTRAKTVEMRERLRAGGFDSPYRLRKQIVEPVFGQIKQARGFRQFLMRGITKVTAEWAMLCTVHNILKLAGIKATASAG